MSLPLRERGLKLADTGGVSEVDDVAPLAGAWIEMPSKSINAVCINVAPLAGAWIEIITGKTERNCIGGRSPCGSVD